MDTILHPLRLKIHVPENIKMPKGNQVVFQLPTTSIFSELLHSLKLTSHLKMDGCNTSFPLGWPIFRCFVGFSELLVSGRVSTNGYHVLKSLRFGAWRSCWEPLGLKFRQSYGSCSFNKKWWFFPFFFGHIEKNMVKGVTCRCYWVFFFWGGGLNTLGVWSFF